MQVTKKAISNEYRLYRAYAEDTAIEGGYTMNIKKYIARELPPEQSDFSIYFDDEGLTSVGGENCAVYIVPADRRRHSGYNMEEYQEIEEIAEAIIDGFHDVSDKWTNGYNSYATYKEAMEFNDIPYTSRKCHLLKEWTKIGDTSDTDSMAEFLTITTGEEWEVKSFTGYSQGDYCEVVYCKAHYSEEHITEIGKLWLGCGTEFSINDCYGYFVIDTIRWREGDILRDRLAELYGCKPEELEIYLYDGKHTVIDYKIMT